MTLHTISTLETSGSDPIAVCQLFETVFGHSLSAEHWRWKHTPPAPGMAINLVSRDSLGITGHVGATILPGTWGRQAHWMAQITDVMVHPRARGGLQRHGTYGQLIVTLQQRLQALARTLAQPLTAYGFPGRSPCYLGTRLGLYQPLYACEVQPWQGGSRLRWLDRCWILKPIPLQQAGLVAMTEFGAEIDRIWDRHRHALYGHQAGPMLTKNAAYLAWRYASHPQRPYTLWIIQSRACAAVGWLITRRDPYPLLIDSCLPPTWSQPNRSAVLKRLLSHTSGIPDWFRWTRTHHPCRGSLHTGIVAVRLITEKHQAEGPAPMFQPGDTDVH